MAISLSALAAAHGGALGQLGVSAIQKRGSSPTTGGPITAGAAYTVTPPAGTQNGDFVLLYALCLTASHQVAPSGWTMLAANGATSSFSSEFWYAIHSPTLSYAFTCPSGAQSAWMCQSYHCDGYTTTTDSAATGTSVSNGGVGGVNTQHNSGIPTASLTSSAGSHDLIAYGYCWNVSTTTIVTVGTGTTLDGQWNPGTMGGMAMMVATTNPLAASTASAAPNQTLGATSTAKTTQIQAINIGTPWTWLGLPDQWQINGQGTATATLTVTGGGPTVALSGAIVGQAACAVNTVSTIPGPTAIGLMDLMVTTFTSGVMSAWGTPGTGGQGFQNGAFYTYATASTSTGTYAGAISSTTYNLTGNWVFVNLQATLNQVVGTVSTFQMQIDSNNYLEMGQIDGNLVARYNVGGSLTTLYSASLSSLGIGEFTGISLLFQESNGTIYFAWSNGSNWSWHVVASVADPIAVTALLANFTIGTYQSVTNPAFSSWNGLDAILLPTYTYAASPASSVGQASATAAPQLALVGATGGQATATATLSNIVPLTGPVVGQGGATGALTIALVGAVTAIAHPVSAVTVFLFPAANASGAATTTGLTHLLQAGTSVAQGSVTAGLTIRLVGTVVAVAHPVSAVTVFLIPTTAAQATATATASVSGQLPVTTISTQAVVTAAVTVVLAGAVTAQSAVVGATPLTVLTGAVVGRATVAATLSVTGAGVALSGAVVAQAVVTAGTSGTGVVSIDSYETAGHIVKTTTGPLTWSFTNTAGTLLIVAVEANQGGSGTQSVTMGTVTYGGVTMTQVPSTYNTWALGYCAVMFYYLENPPTGSNTVVVNYTLTDPTQPAVMGGAMSFTGANLGAEFGTPAFAKDDTGAGDASTSVTLSSTTAGDIALGLEGSGSGFSSSTNTVQWYINDATHNAGDNTVLLSQIISSSGPTTLNATIVLDWWGFVAVEIIASAVAIPALTVILPGITTGQATATATLTVAGGLSGAVVAQATVTASLSIALAGRVTAQSTIVAGLSLSAVGSTGGQGSSSGTTGLVLAGTSTAQASATAALSVALGGTALAQASVAAAPLVALSGAAVAQAVVAGITVNALSGAVAAQAVVSGALTVAVTGAVVAQSAVSAQIPLTLLTGTIAAQGQVTGALTIALVGSVTTSAALTGTIVGAALTGTSVTQGSVTAAPQLALVGASIAGAVTSANLGTGSNLFSTSGGQASATAALSIALVGSTSSSAVLTAATSVALSGSIAPQASTSATLAVAIPISATVTAQAVITGNSTLGFAGGAVGQAVVSGATAGAAALSGATVAQASASATLNVAIVGATASQVTVTSATSLALVGVTGGQATSSATLFVSIPITGAVAAQASASASLTILLVGSAAAQAVTSGIALTAGQLVGSTTGQAAIVAAPNLALTGQTAAQASPSATLLTAGALAGTSVGQASTSAALSVTNFVTGASVANGSTSATLTVVLSGQTASRASATAAIAVSVFAGVAAAQGSASASLTILLVGAVVAQSTVSGTALEGNFLLGFVVAQAQSTIALTVFLTVSIKAQGSIVAGLLAPPKGVPTYTVDEELRTQFMCSESLTTNYTPDEELRTWIVCSEVVTEVAPDEEIAHPYELVEAMA